MKLDDPTWNPFQQAVLDRIDAAVGIGTFALCLAVFALAVIAVRSLRS